MKKLKEFFVFWLYADQPFAQALRLVKNLWHLEHLEKICAHETALRISYQDAITRMSNDLSRANEEIQNLKSRLDEMAKPV